MPVIVKKALAPLPPTDAPESVPPEAAVVPEEAKQMQQQQSQGGTMGPSAGSWVRLEEVIGFLQNVDKNREGHEIEIVAKSNTTGIHKFEITVKKKPMMGKATDMGQAASSDKPVKIAGPDPKKTLKNLYPNEFLKSMGLL